MLLPASARNKLSSFGFLEEYIYIYIYKHPNPLWRWCNYYLMVSQQKLHWVGNAAMSTLVWPRSPSSGLFLIVVDLLLYFVTNWARCCSLIWLLHSALFIFSVEKMQQSVGTVSSGVAKIVRAVHEPRRNLFETLLMITGVPQII